ncbi:iron(III) transport system ATP-binding protein [Neorhizobium galegae]|uniref:ABC transporter ATP-binding protein n=1 Tax=Neorhizobium galegae TaxID=399 RepID=UPI00278AB40A|nr:ABC transporter ATP-binding protein [Neorhizobium galegae]MDQ0137773.1 iron(III) transport system ATP-binding protein [Neorhizobium galegae]
MLTVNDLCKRFTLPGGRVFDALANVSLEVKEGQFFTLLGPSGCGKTTMLRSMAGLETPDSGCISINNETVFNSANSTFVAANRRKIGMVFQSYAIWPHMNVFENVAFPLRVSQQRYSEQEVRRRVREALATIRMEEFETRQATRLSGGQQQRLAMARALVMNPRLLLLDEPLSNLDALLREAMRLELARLQKQHGITTIYVTHDQSEALALSDQIAVMNGGKIVQVGSPERIFDAPKSAFVADFIGSTNILQGTLLGKSDGRSTISWNGASLQSCMPTELSQGSQVAMSVRPASIRISEKQAPALNSVAGLVKQKSFQGTSIDYVIDVAGFDIRATGPAQTAFGIGENVTLHFRPEAIPLFDPAKDRAVAAHV